MLDRRIRVHLDEDRYQKLASEAQRRGSSMAAVVRDAIDQLPGDIERRRAALAAIFDAEPMAMPLVPSELRRELDTAHDRILA